MSKRSNLSAVNEFNVQWPTLVVMGAQVHAVHQCARVNRAGLRLPVGATGSFRSRQKLQHVSAVERGVFERLHLPSFGDGTGPKLVSAGADHFPGVFP